MTIQNGSTSIPAAMTTNKPIKTTRARLNDASFEASPAGANTFSSTLLVSSLGQTYDYRVRFTLAPVGTVNTNPSGTTNDTINPHAVHVGHGGSRTQPRKRRYSPAP